MCRHEIDAQYKWFKYSILVMIAMITGFVSIGLCSVKSVYADAPAMGDFGQPIIQHRHDSDYLLGKSQNTNALFVTEGKSGRCAMEEHVVADDAIAGFAGEHPAWKLNVGLSWYFMEPVYERNTSLVEGHDGRIAL